MASRVIVRGDGDAEILFQLRGELAYWAGASSPWRPHPESVKLEQCTTGLLQGRAASSSYIFFFQRCRRVSATTHDVRGGEIGDSQRLERENRNCFRIIRAKELGILVSPPMVESFFCAAQRNRNAFCGKGDFQRRIDAVLAQ